jgi:hypothetical protein
MTYISEAEDLMCEEVTWAVLSLYNLTQERIVKALLKEVIENYMERNEV